MIFFIKATSHTFKLKYWCLLYALLNVNIYTHCYCMSIANFPSNFITGINPMHLFPGKRFALFIFQVISGAFLHLFRIGNWGVALSFDALIKRRNAARQRRAEAAMNVASFNLCRYKRYINLRMHKRSAVLPDYYEMGVCLVFLFRRELCRYQSRQSCKTQSKFACVYWTCNNLKSQFTGICCFVVRFGITQMEN